MNVFPRNVKPNCYVPKMVFIFLFIGFFMQILWHYNFTKFELKQRPLPEPPTYKTASIFSFGEKTALAKLTMLWLQSFDNQPGVSIPLKNINYEILIKWLDLILKLDERAYSPLLAAIRFYAEVPVFYKQYLMTEFVFKKFLEAPNQRWVAMAHAVYISKHKMKNLLLAAKYARELRLNVTDKNIPHWARQMEFFILEDMGEFESAKILIGALLESGELKDPKQINFLIQKLDKIKKHQ